MLTKKKGPINGPSSRLGFRLEGEKKCFVLSANKECSKATLQISDKGLAHIEFNVDDFNVKYWLVSQQT